jgi:hypothetical protein
MTGEAHDRLHLLLNPMLAAIDRLRSGNGGDADVATLRTLLDDYHSHFER